jgi:Ca-activated chloride channel family protein
MNELAFTRPFLWPWFLLLPVLFAALWWTFGRARLLAWRYGAPSQDLVPKPWARASRCTALAGLGLLCWMDPRYGDELLAVERRGLDVIFCLDTSRSMLARDLEPTRLARARQDIAAVLPAVRGGDRVGLCVFAGQARLWIPLTHDVDSFRGLLDEVDTDIVPVGGSDLAAALRKARELADPENRKTTAVVLLTDGEDLAGAGRQAATELGAVGIVVHCIGYGDARGSKITLAQDGKETFLKGKDGQEVVSAMDVESLRAIAQATGGECLRADAMALPLQQLHERRLLGMEKRAYDQGEQKGKRARYQWVLLPMVLLLLIEIATSGGRRR